MSNPIKTRKADKICKFIQDKYQGCEINENHIVQIIIHVFDLLN
jgi:hypothetical protein